MNGAAPSPIVAPALLEKPFLVDGPEALRELALELFALHAAHSPVYREYLDALGVSPGNVSSVDRIPCLPIGLFRNRNVLLEGLNAALRFTSSGTTGPVTSTHHVPWR